MRGGYYQGRDTRFGRGGRNYGGRYSNSKDYGYNQDFRQDYNGYKGYYDGKNDHYNEEGEMDNSHSGNEYQKYPVDQGEALESGNYNHNYNYNYNFVGRGGRYQGRGGRGDRGGYYNVGRGGGRGYGQRGGDTEGMYSSYNHNSGFHNVQQEDGNEQESYTHYNDTGGRGYNESGEDYRSSGGRFNKMPYRGGGRRGGGGRGRGRFSNNTAYFNRSTKDENQNYGGDEVPEN